MGGKYKPYPKYKASGVEWLGDMPEGWDIGRLKFYTKQIVDGTHFTPNYLDDGIPFLRVTDIQTKDIDLSLVKYISYSQYIELNQRCNPQKGDILLSKNGTIGKVKIIDWDWRFSIFVSLCLIKLRTTLLPLFAKFYFESNQLQTQIFGLIKQSTVINLHLDKIANFIFMIPSLLEQRQIVIFLDREVGKIDALIAKQERLVELLTEKRQAVISHAVTKGLNPNAPMKPSAIDWLGDIPEHWGVMSIKRIVNIINGSTPKSDIESYWEGDIVWVTPSDLSQVENKYINSSKRRITQSGFYSCGTSLVPENSIILSTRAPIGSLAINKTILCTNQGCKSLVLKRESISLFFYYLLLISTEQLNLLGRGSTFLELSSEDLGSFSVTVPPFTEQQQIAEYLDQETQKIDSLIQKSQHMVILLKERKTALISAAVTGKIDVRN